MLLVQTAYLGIGQQHCRHFEQRDLVLAPVFLRPNRIETDETETMPCVQQGEGNQGLDALRLQNLPYRRFWRIVRHTGDVQ